MIYERQSWPAKKRVRRQDRVEPGTLGKDAGLGSSQNPHEALVGSNSTTDCAVGRTGIDLYRYVLRKPLTGKVQPCLELSAT